MKCASHKRCQSINYKYSYDNKSLQTCELNDAVKSQTLDEFFILRSGFVYYEMVIKHQVRCELVQNHAHFKNILLCIATAVWVTMNAGTISWRREQLPLRILIDILRLVHYKMSFWIETGSF